MATMTLKLRVKVAWWIKPYLYGVITMCAITGCEPNQERVQYWISRAVSVKVTA
jgi:hypothetical protein